MSTKPSPMYPMNFRQLTNIQYTFANIPYELSPIPENVRQTHGFVSSTSLENKVMSLSYLHKGEDEVSFEEHGAQSFRMEYLDTFLYSLAKVQ